MISMAALIELIAGSPSAQALFDADFRCLAHSSSWNRELGLVRGLEVGSTLFETMPGCPSSWRELCLRAIEGQKGEIPEETYISHLGRAKRVRVVAQPCAGGFLLTVQDLDEVLQARQAIAEAGRLKTEFFATMSHEIRTPLNAITGMAELLLDTALTDEQREWAAIVRTSGDSLLSVINDLLDFSRIESGRLLLEPSEFSPLSVIEDAIELFTARASDKGLELLSFVSPDLPLRLRGDAGRLGQVLLNLTSNAIKFTHQGEVVIRAFPESERAGKITIRFEVIDTGIGIADSHHARIFEPFTQADGSMTRRYGGTGLGLSLSQRLVHLMGGTIGCNSVEGRGSVFHVSLEFDVVQSAAKAPLNHGTKRVLIADENARSREYLQKYFGHWNFIYEEATSVPQAWEMLAAPGRGPSHFDIVLVNLSGPSGGLAFARGVKSAFGAASPRLAVMLSHHERIRRRDISDASGIVCLSKPLRQQELWAALAGSRGAERPLQKFSNRKNSVSQKPRPILVVEDNPVNRQVALLQLAKLGYARHSVANGLEAVEAWQRSSYSLILMDCQMPEMDGFEATRAIRRLEGKGRERVPIIAMTANAMLGDREKCLLAGMDDYIAKPVTKEHLEKVLAHWLKGSGEPVQGAVPEEDEEPVLDINMLSGLRELQSEGDTDVLQGLIDIYLNTTAVRLQELYRAVLEDDAKLFKRTAHTLKSSCAQLGARRMAAYCRELEHKGSATERELDAIRNWLGSEYSRVKQALHEFSVNENATR